MVLQRAGENLRTAGGEGVDENHHREIQLLHLAPLRPDLLRQRRLPVRGADDDALLRQEDRSELHRRPDQSARIVAQIDDQRGDPLLFEPGERLAELGGRMGAEALDAKVADRTGELLHRVRRHRGADHLCPLDGELQQILHALPGHLELRHAARLPPGEGETTLHIELLREFSVDLDQPVPGAESHRGSGRIGHHVDHQQRHIPLFDDLDAEADQFAGPPGFVGGKLLRRFVSGVGIEVGHHPPQRRGQQFLVADPVGLHVVVVQKFDGLRENRRLAVGLFTDQRTLLLPLRDSRAPAAGENDDRQAQQHREKQPGSLFHRYQAPFLNGIRNIVWYQEYSTESGYFQLDNSHARDYFIKRCLLQ